MNFRQLEAFIAIVQLGSFAAAATRLNATQSAISARVQELESSLGIELFDRRHRRVRLTPKGRELLEYAERAMDLASEIKHRVGAPEIFSGVVRVGVAELIALTWLPQFVALVSERYPLISLDCHVSLTRNVAARLKAGEIDVALIPDAVGLDSGYERQGIGANRLVWMASPRLGLHGRTLAQEELVENRLILMGPGSLYHDVGLANSSRSAIARPMPIICDSMNTVAYLTKAGLGISLLSPECYAYEIASDQLVLLSTSHVPRLLEFVAAYPRGRQNAAYRAIAEMAREASTFPREQEHEGNVGKNAAGAATPMKPAKTRRQSPIKIIDDIPTK
ncbi:LysR family transcriptional regulator [Hyphomicrobium sp. CS1BSMeth3]|uniref:LysR family transcriptional regulator n=1 Tax=Hyphomicrobium sp. CS1BSMeth3 TaxID=1892844 RepID=UPI000931EFDE|nr:LysR family transcriptional regulator [Hyphomicrobium sp. CS1BSMeth3]